LSGVEWRSQCREIKKDAKKMLYCKKCLAKNARQKMLGRRNRPLITLFAAAGDFTGWITAVKTRPACDLIAAPGIQSSSPPG
jgi:hypothetical protein